MRKKLQTPFDTRQHMLSKDFELYYYNDPHYTPTKKHSHNYYEFYFFLQGDIDMHIDGEIFDLKIGDIILIPPGVSHHAIGRNPDIPYRRFILWISKEYYQRMCGFSSDYSYMVDYTLNKHHFVYHTDVVNFNMIQTKLFRIVEEIHYDRFGRDTKIPLCIMDLVLHLNRLVYEITKPPKKKEQQNLYENLLSYIDDHLAEDLSLEQLAEVFFISKYHIAHVFKDNLGISVHQYILKKRLAMCREALLSQSSISKTFYMYGFKDYSSFFRAFKKEYGVSPKEYREIHGISLDEL